MNRLLKRLAQRLPKSWQQSLRQRYLRYNMRSSRFRRICPEYDLLPNLVRPGDWVIDVGANIGLYATRLSELVGPTGRVIAIEPIPSTFQTLVNVLNDCGYSNTTLINAAVADDCRVTGMKVPSDAEYDGYYTAEISQSEPDHTVLCISLDALNLPAAIRLVKIDTEGHELAVLKGMLGLLRRDRPALLIELNSSDVRDFLTEMGYKETHLERSSNSLFEFPPHTDSGT